MSHSPKISLCCGHVMRTHHREVEFHGALLSMASLDLPIIGLLDPTRTDPSPVGIPTRTSVHSSRHHAHVPCGHATPELSSLGEITSASPRVICFSGKLDCPMGGVNMWNLRRASGSQAFPKNKTTPPLGAKKHLLLIISSASHSAPELDHM